MEFEENQSWNKILRFRVIIAVLLIGVLTPFWIYLLFFTNVSMIVMAVIALTIILIFSTATAWTATAIPGQRSGSDDPRS